MTWSIEQEKHVVFQRNPLISTDVELRFYPILKIGEPIKITEYQDKVRTRFPMYNRSSVRSININPTGQFEIQDETQFMFSDTEDRASFILTQQSLRLSNKNHIDKEKMIDNFLFGLAFLQECFGEIIPNRLGVRYVNVIDREKISKDLSRPQIGWQDLVSEEFLKIPHDFADMTATNFLTEIRSPVDENKGTLVLRYGLVQDDKSIPDHFRFDLDRFSESPIDLGSIKPILDRYSIDILSVFLKAAGPQLTEWMKG
ncbi:TIGR04255 family protein [Hahella sp. NBU794]|uniref:TIGR04255 family protein n=1 Tax=Hahella sp. NBU794 TaxID=3422590 RepID=UPI003D701920